MVSTQCGDDDVTLGDCDDAIMVTYVTMVQYGVGWGSVLLKKTDDDGFSLASTDATNLIVNLTKKILSQQSYLTPSKQEGVFTSQCKCDYFTHKIEWPVCPVQLITML